MTPEKLKKLNELDEKMNKIDKILNHGPEFFSAKVVDALAEELIDLEKEFFNL